MEYNFTSETSYDKYTEYPHKDYKNILVNSLLRKEQHNNTLHIEDPEIEEMWDMMFDGISDEPETDNNIDYILDYYRKFPFVKIANVEYIPKYLEETAKDFYTADFACFVLSYKKNGFYETLEKTISRYIEMQDDNKKEFAFKYINGIINGNKTIECPDALICEIIINIKN